MVTKTYICPNGHTWRDDGKCPRCPLCGEQWTETIGNGDAMVETSRTGVSHEEDAPVESFGRTQFGRYQVIDQLGQGGMGIVYRVFDPAQQREVALKTLPSSNATLLSRFKREFRAIAGIDHPNVIQLYELHSDGEVWYFTMEIVNGVDLLTYLSEGISAQDEEDSLGAELTMAPVLSDDRLQRIRDSFSQLSEAIDALHTRGIIHRDIKPSNVIVRPKGRLALLDFGLVAETNAEGLHQSLHQQVMGTASYMSPEQAACEPVSTASDWYSVGVMLYLAITGRLPHSGKTLDILVKKQKKDPAAPKSIVNTIPDDLNQLCVQLLNRDPAERPQPFEILRRLGKQDLAAQQIEAAPRGQMSLVGRDDQIHSLRESWQRVRGGQPECVFVEGPSGTGKSALVDAFIGRESGKDSVVLSGRCYEMESVPFKAIDSLIDSLVAYLAQLRPADASALLPRDVHALSRLFPVFLQLEPVASLPRRKVDFSDQKELNRRAVAAVRELLARLGDRYPLVVYIDDLQWGDEDSAAMLSDLLQPPDPPLLLFIGTYRSEDSERSPFLGSFRQIQQQRSAPLQLTHLMVDALEYDAALTLAQMLLGDSDSVKTRSTAESIVRDAGGNPFFVSELVKHRQLSGFQSTGSASPLGLDDMIWSRVQRLPDDAKQLLAVVALSGQPLPIDRALQVAGVGQSAIGPLRSGHLIRMFGHTSASKIETYHDRVRESVSERLDTEIRQRLHLKIAEDDANCLPLAVDEIESRLTDYLNSDSAPIDDYVDVTPGWYDVAFHFDAGGQPDSAFVYAMACAEKSRSQFSLELAEQQYRIAQRSSRFQESEIRRRVSEGLGDVLMLRGNYPAAATQFEIAREQVSDDSALARIECKLGELAFKRGNNEAASVAMERSLRLLGRWVPSHTAGFLVLMAWELVVQTMHTLSPKFFLHRRSLEGSENEFLAIRIYTRLAYAYFFDRGKVPCMWAHLRAINLVEQYPQTLELGHAWATHAPVMSLIPWLARGEMFAEKSFEIRKELGDVWGQGQSLHYWGIVLFVAARYDECIEKCHDAIHRLEQTGDYWEVNIAWYAIANSTYRKGNLKEAVALAERLHDAAGAIGDDKVSGFSLDVWSRASGGQLPADVVQCELKRERHDVQATAQVMLAEGVRLIGNDELARAIDVMDQAHETCRKVGMKNAWVSPLLTWLATARRLQWQRATDESSDDRRLMLDDARKSARKALEMARQFQSDLPHALRERGLIDAIDGAERRCRQHLDESVEVSQRQGALVEHAQSLLARGSAGRMFGWKGAEDDRTAGIEALTKLSAEFARPHCEIPQV